MSGFDHWNVRECWHEDAKERLFDTPKTSDETESTKIVLRADLVDASLSQVNPVDAELDNIMMAVRDAGKHFKSMESVLSNMVTFRFDRELPDTVSKAFALLQRLPLIPPRLGMTHAANEGDSCPRLRLYFSSNVPEDWRPSTHPLISRIWSELQAVSQFSVIVIKIALLIASTSVARYDVGAQLHRLLNFMSDMVDAMEPRSWPDPSSFIPKEDQLFSDIAKVYLWSTWTRSMQLFFWFVLRHHLDQGHEESWNRLLALRGMGVLSHPSVNPQLHDASSMTVPYMCTWAFQLLRLDRSSVGLDFRHFYQKFTELHGMKAGRCRWGSVEPCDGRHPLSCGRFQDKRLVAEEQSVHDCFSRNCSRLIWDRNSYVSTKGPKAINARVSDRIEFVRASEYTMAVSHVWSHGHGGRPHTGQNKCLHERFANIASSHSCTSYWIDTLCIPYEHQLRKEAISFINHIFAESNMVLVLDRDIMDIDGRDMTIEQLESFLATYLVCDWNVRAWTMLEAMKGCHNLWLLCKNKQTVSLRDSLIRVQKEGRVDFAVLFLAAQHLLPSSTDPFLRRASRKSLEGSGSLLSQRHATRDGDDIIIWSLISGVHVYNDAKEFWQARIGRPVRTAFLMSSSPRLEGIRGFSWAPRTPYVRHSNPVGLYITNQLSLVHDGEGSEEAKITKKGLLGDWLVYHMNEDDDKRYRDTPIPTTVIENGVRKKVFLKSHRIVNKCWKAAYGLTSNHLEVALLHPIWHGKYGINGEIGGRTDSHGTFFAICVSQDGEHWTWKGVEMWPRSIDTPNMVIDELLIV